MCDKSSSCIFSAAQTANYLPHVPRAPPDRTPRAAKGSTRRSRGFNLLLHNGRGWGGHFAKDLVYLRSPSRESRVPRNADPITRRSRSITRTVVGCGTERCWMGFSLLTNSDRVCSWKRDDHTHGALKLIVFCSECEVRAVDGSFKNSRVKCVVVVVVWSRPYFNRWVSGVKCLVVDEPVWGNRRAFDHENVGFEVHRGGC